jgi:hypothetical protein
MVYVCPYTELLRTVHNTHTYIYIYIYKRKIRYAAKMRHAGTQQGM